MYKLIGYYKGPERQKSLPDYFLGREGSVIYNLKPQLFKEGNSSPLRSFGVFSLNFGLTEPTPENLETVLTAELRKKFNVGISIIPVENIKITVEKSEE